MRISNLKSKLYFLSEMVSDEFVNKMIIKSSECTTLSPVIGDQSYRTSHQVKLTDGIEEVQKMISDLTKLPIENQEALSLVKYRKGEFFGRHFDLLESQEDNPRMFSVVIGIQEAKKGGETHFPDKGETYKLKAKDVLFWENYYDGMLTDTMHESLPILEGEKIVIITWVHKDKFIR